MKIIITGASSGIGRAIALVFGRAGHAVALAEGLRPGGRLVALDMDPQNAAWARQRLSGLDAAVHVEGGNFSELTGVLRRLGLERVDGVLADLGFASSQMEDPARGLSFTAEGPLDMRLDPDLPETAADLIHRLPERELADLIYQYGEERLSRRIAHRIVAFRGKQRIEDTATLAELVRSAYGPAAGRQRIDPATRTFMALRIAVNHELASLDRLLEALPTVLAEGGVAAIISFHSLEDRRVKQAFRGWSDQSLAERLTRKPVVADEAEQRANPRSRSAKLRAIRWRG